MWTRTHCTQYHLGTLILLKSKNLKMWTHTHCTQYHLKLNLKNKHLTKKNKNECGHVPTVPIII